MSHPDRRRPRTVAARAPHRVRQFVEFLTRHPDPRADRRLRALLSPLQWELVARLGPGDRRHLLAVHDRLVAGGCADQDLLLAALLHDVGKADAHGRVGLTQRVVAVLLGGLAPSILARVAGPDRRGWWHGLYLAREHAALGAEAAWETGCSARVRWLIAHHHDDDVADPGLRRLHAADEGGD